MHTIADKKLLMLRPDEINPSANQPRKTFDEYGLKILADSIATSGIIQPLAIRKTPGGNYELIAGERRLRAAVMAGLRRVPCVLHKTNDETAAFFAIVENLQRSNLTVFEEAESINRLIYEFGITQAEVAVKLGIAQSTLSNKLRLLRLSEEMRQRIVSARLTERHARALLRIPDEQREDTLNCIIAEGLTLQQTEAMISDLLCPQEEPLENIAANPILTAAVRNEPVRKSAIGDVRLFSNSLSKLLDTLQNAGIEAKSQRSETDQYIEYTVHIAKQTIGEERPNTVIRLKA